MNYQIVHNIAGRLRIRIPQLAHDAEFASRLSGFVESLAGVTQVRINPAASSIVIQYQPSVGAIVESFHSCICKAHGVESDEAPQSIETDPEINHWQDLGLPVISLGAALLAAPLELPAIVVGGAIAGAALPWVVRATDSIVNRQKPNIDLLDSLWMGLQASQGQFAAPALKTVMVETRRALRGTVAEQREKQAKEILEWFDREILVDRDGHSEWIAAKAVQEGDRISVIAGERIPVDGWIVEGTALIEEGLTEASSPIVCSEGHVVYASAKVLTGKITVVAQHSGINTRIGKVIQLTLNAPVHDTEIGVHQAELVTNAIIPTIFFGGAMFALTGSFGAAVSPFQFDFGSGIPISVHTTLLTALTYAARHGIYIRSARTLELLSKVDAIVLDHAELIDRSELETTIATLERQGITLYWIKEDSFNDQTCHSDRATHLISGLQHYGRTVAVVGSSGAEQANVSIAFEDPTSNADVILMHEDLRGVIEAIEIAKRAMQVVYENTAIIVLPNLLIQIGGGMILGIHPVFNVLTNNGSAIIAEFVHGTRPLFDHRTPTPVKQRSRTSKRSNRCKLSL
ncbi:HMA2 domain-containing protein [Leptolyngbya sp. AN03gr2]|uniref:P-type ATPase n=1 Tax=unclassified Leptolyngbya TaxID=2650499 RepID=UPI003D3210E0